MSLYLLLKNGSIKIVTYETISGYFYREIDSNPISQQKFVDHSEVVMVDTNLHVIKFYKKSLCRSMNKYPSNY